MNAQMDLACVVFVRNKFLTDLTELLEIVFFLTVKTGCGQTTNQLDSYFQNPGWPEASQDRLICTLTLELQEGVSQVRLDFILLEVSEKIDNSFGKSRK